MLARIRTFFDSYLDLRDADVSDPAHALQLAAAALLIEITHTDHEITPEENSAVTQTLQEHLGLSREEAEELMRCAEAEQADATDYHQFTTLINRSYSAKQKAHLVEMLWRVAYSDNRLHRYEEHAIRKIADLLHVSHSSFIAAKHRANPDA